MVDEGGSATGGPDTPLRPEPSRSPPKTATLEPEPPAPRRRRWRLVALVVIGALLVGAIGYVVAFVSLGGNGGRGRTAERNPFPPENLSAEAGRFEVTLSWSAPEGTVEGYRVYRDDLFRGALPSSATSYVDEAVPGEAYEYTVEAFAGSRISEPASITIRTERAPLKLARLEGTFRVATKVVSDTGYQNYAASRMSWRFKPKCADGACNVVWRDLSFKGLRTDLKQRGTNYRGEDSGAFNVSCGESTSVSDVTVSIKVTKARAVSGEWRVAKFVGTFTHTESAQGGCVTSSATLSIRGNLAAP